MLGPSAEAVVQSLSRARRFHSLSLFLGIVALGILTMSPLEWRVSAFGNFKAPIEAFTLFAMILSAGALSFTKAFLEDALEGTRCLRDRDSAMVVGRFPWILTRFTGHRWDKRILSFVLRAGLAFHPAIYIFMPHNTLMWYDWGLGVIIALFSVWVFVLSQKFQRPILFDSKTEVYKNRDINTISAQLDEVLDLIKNGDHRAHKRIHKLSSKKKTEKNTNGKTPPRLKPHIPEQMLEQPRQVAARVSSKSK